jgi:hypothetical protein
MQALSDQTTVNHIEYQKYLDELLASLEADPLVLGLILLGSTADTSLRDGRSDHDFWIVTSPGGQKKYRDTFSWLPNSDDILFTVRHGTSYRAVIYGNRHKAEYAVFDPEEALHGKIERFRVLLDRQDIVSLAERVRSRTYEERDGALGRPDRLENICMLLWGAFGKSDRGEIMSARRDIQFSIDGLLDLLTEHHCLDVPNVTDRLDARRRLELIDPYIASELDRIITLAPGAEASIALIELAEKKLMPCAPELAWDKALIVKSWLLQGC